VRCWHHRRGAVSDEQLSREILEERGKALHGFASSSRFRWITALTRAFAIVTQSRGYILNHTSALHAIYPGECYATTNFLEPDSFAEFKSTRTAFINHVECAVTEASAARLKLGTLFL
jgi:hypothetical protein